MITAALLLIAGSQGQAPSASKIVSDMLARYSRAQTLTGTIRLTQGVGNTAGTLDTRVQFERPAKLYIGQMLNTGSKKRWLVTSDGAFFSYDKPENLPGANRRLMEPVKPPRTGETFDIRTIYKVVRQTLGDQSAPLDIAIGRPDDLQAFAAQLVTLEYRGVVAAGEEELHSIAGGWRWDASGPAVPTGTYEMYITKAGDLRRYVVKQSVRPDPANQNYVVEVVSAWDVSLVVDGKPEPDLFKVVR